MSKQLNSKKIGDNFHKIVEKLISIFRQEDKSTSFQEKKGGFDKNWCSNFLASHD